MISIIPNHLLNFGCMGENGGVLKSSLLEPNIFLGKLSSNTLYNSHPHTPTNARNA